MFHTNSVCKKGINTEVSVTSVEGVGSNFYPCIFQHSFYIVLHKQHFSYLLRYFFRVNICLKVVASLSTHLVSYLAQWCTYYCNNLDMDDGESFISSVYPTINALEMTQQSNKGAMNILFHNQRKNKLFKKQWRLVLKISDITIVSFNLFLFASRHLLCITNSE